MKAATLFLCSMIFCLASCKKEKEPETAMDYLPLAEGNSWEYNRYLQAIGSSREQVGTYTAKAFFKQNI